MLRQLTRAIHTSSRAYAAQFFRMPAMSPTMTEGGITSWKLKKGDTFAAGDVLLEVETDKATIDVEAQDDGVVVDILLHDGDSGIPVGKPIAILAEPGDDIASIELPKEEKQPEQPKETKAPKEEPKEAQQPAKEAKEEPKKANESPKASSGSQGGLVGKASPAQKFFPSVEVLLHKHHISREKALAEIPASGPKGRILKGDVLAYLGEISEKSVADVASFINHRSHLDLSNIQLKEAVKEEPKAEAKKEAPKNILNIRLHSQFEDIINPEKFKYAFEQSIQSAITQTYSHRFPQYSRPSASAVDLEEIFDDLLVAAPTVPRLEVYDVSYKFESAPAVSHDLFDEILGLPAKKAEKKESRSVDVEFKVRYNDKLADAEKFVDEFKTSLLSQVPANAVETR